VATVVGFISSRARTSYGVTSIRDGVRGQSVRDHDGNSRVTREKDEEKNGNKNYNVLDDDDRNESYQIKLRADKKINIARYKNKRSRRRDNTYRLSRVCDYIVGRSPSLVRSRRRLDKAVYYLSS